MTRVGPTDVSPSDARGVDAYIAGQPPWAQAALVAVREAIRAAAPAVEETIAYDMPTFRLGRRTVLHVAAWKDHYSLYPVSPKLLAALGPAAAGLDHQKSTLRFAYGQPAPPDLIRAIVGLRVTGKPSRPPKAR